MVSLLDRKDIIALRLTCKKLEKAAANSFASHFIKCRRHVLSTHSLKTLAEIAAHPYFGMFIEAIILDTTRSLEYIKSFKSFQSLKTDRTADGSLTYFDSYSALKEVLDNLSMHGNLNTLGVTDRNPTSFGIQELLSRPTAHIYKQERSHVLSTLRYIAKGANFNISQLDVDSVQARGSDSRGLDVCDFSNTTFDFAKGLLPSTSFKFKVAMTNMDDFGMIWDHKRRSLEISGLTQWSSADPENMLFSLFYNVTSLSTANITELTLSGCRVEDFDYSKLMELFHICSKTLKRVRLSGLVIEGDSTWSPVLRLLAQAPHLMKFEMATLSRQVHGFFNLDRRTAVIVNVDEWFGHGDQVSAELKDLAVALEADDFAWESLNNAEKWTYHMVGRSKTSNMLEEESLNNSESITSDDNLDVNVD